MPAAHHVRDEGFAGSVAVECSSGSAMFSESELTRKLIWLTCARPNERSLAAAAVLRRGCKLAYYAAMTA